MCSVPFLWSAVGPSFTRDPPTSSHEYVGRLISTRSPSITSALDMRAM
jgi:hypothetical protein